MLDLRHRLQDLALLGRRETEAIAYADGCRPWAAPIVARQRDAHEEYEIQDLTGLGDALDDARCSTEL